MGTVRGRDVNDTQLAAIQRLQEALTGLVAAGVGLYAYGGDLHAFDADEFIRRCGADPSKPCEDILMSETALVDVARPDDLCLWTDY
jgi:hypothetical protein